jgi:hypothetical protein
MDWAIVCPVKMDPAKRKEALEAAQRAGIDLSLLDANLALSVRDRWQQHDAALDFAMKLQNGRRLRDAQLQPATGATG